ncbi:hypothetical protein ABB37_06668 [Leptomonas pyrrhocoris]|uniref:LysM domain-containing protein n=1 Tax=Leptomonas pyrrhocoris TaxID=157538 RepID=A0A0N0DTT3_LEPPY|nr:hypothetical protein ABB37_06668 [Leptomonas pyrrhocoris]KPA77872.1 hypothetical protein ABB37_06668 [Leptomonas pyrrhocoris]|eukprot:XP_015656311.1 hypothetical protein ABB37_06668 [Leptomonas pyrrhocoris]
MEGLSTQLQLLHAALQSLDLNPSTLEDGCDTVSELQLTLARATALAQWAAVRQHPPPTIKDGVKKEKSEGGARAQKTAVQSNGNAPTLEAHGSHTTSAQRDDETLLSVATALQVSMADLRTWNPQLPDSLKATDVLPPNTYLKVRRAGPNPSAGPPLLLQRPSLLSKPHSATQPTPRLAAPSRSSARSSGGQSSEQHNLHPRSSSGIAPTAAAAVPAPQSGSSVPSISAFISNAPLARSVNASLSSNWSGSGVPRGSEGGSTSRLSLWTGESGRGTSHSPPPPEPSMPEAQSSADPPTCAPVPIIMGVLEVFPPPSSAGKTDEGRSGEFYVTGEEPSPSPERQGEKAAATGEASEAPTTPTSLMSAAAPTATGTGVATAHEPTSPLRLLPQQPLGEVINSGNAPLRTSAGASSSGTSIRSVHTRGRSQSTSSSPLTRSAERHTVSTSQRSGAAAMPPSMTSPPKSAALSPHNVNLEGSKNHSDGTGKSRVKVNLFPSPKARPDRTRLAADVFADAPKVGASVLHKAGEDEEALRRVVRDPSASLSTVSAATSPSDDRSSSNARPAESATPRQLANSPILVTSPSLEGPSSTSSMSSLNTGARQEKPIAVYPTPPSLPESAKAATAAAAAVNFSTPVQKQQQRRQPTPSSQCGAAAIAAEGPLCSPISSSSYTSSSSGPNGKEEREEGNESGDNSSLQRSPLTSDSDFEEDSIEDTPSARIPAMLGRNGCSPPPTLSRARRANTSASCGSGGAAAPAVTKAVPWAPAKTVSSPSPLPEYTPKVQRSAAAEVDFSEKEEEPLTTQPSSRVAAPRPTPQEERAPSTPRMDRWGTGRESEAQPTSSASVSQKFSHQRESVEEEGLVGEEEEEATAASHKRDNPGHGGEKGAEEEYDTLAGIAAAYQLTVAIIVEWNPYLKKYHPGEPLPPDLPIVLPMSDNDEEGAEGEDGDEVRVDREEAHDEEELYSAADMRQLRHSGTPLDTFTAVAGNSPAPIPPVRY